MCEVDAIKILEIMAIDLAGTLAGLKPHDPLEDVIKQRIDAINTAQNALHAQSKRMACAGVG